MADDEQDIRRITRFPKGADAHVKRTFAQTLVAALDELGVEPGRDFVVAAYQDELKPDEPEVTQADVERAENAAHRERDSEAVEVLLAVYDYQRGLIDLEECVRRVRWALRKVIGSSDMTIWEHASIGLGNTMSLKEPPPPQ
jgi:hypothetical protein